MNLDILNDILSNGSFEDVWQGECILAGGAIGAMNGDCWATHVGCWLLIAVVNLQN